MSFKIKPQSDRVVVECRQAQTSRGGILLPESAQKKPKIGCVVATGPGARRADGELIAMGVKVGDTVYYSNYSGTEIELDGKEYLILRESDIFGVIEE